MSKDFCEKMLPTNVDEVRSRLDLVNRYNVLVKGQIGAQGEEQRRFVMGEMTDEEVVSFRRLYEYLTHTAQNS
jgi:hypothetical protein